MLTEKFRLSVSELFQFSKLKPLRSGISPNCTPSSIYILLEKGVLWGESLLCMGYSHFSWGGKDFFVGLCY